MNANKDNKEVFFDFIRPEIRKLAMQMEQKFRLHDEERGNPFDIRMSYDELIDFTSERLECEEDELYTAMGLIGNPRKPPSVVFSETADVCNFHLIRAIAYEKEWLKGVQ